MAFLEIIPFVGYEVEKMTYHENDELGDIKTHSSMYNEAMSEEFNLTSNYIDLKNNSNFLEARKIINKKNNIGVKKYSEICNKIADNMHITRKQKVKQSLSNELDNLNHNQKNTNKLKIKNY